MFSKYRCPRCYEDSQSVVYTCKTPGCDRAQAPQPAADAKVDEQGVHSCADCGKPLTARLCPDCGYPLLAGISDAPFLPLMLAGAPESGKSTYLSVLVHRIRQDLCKLYGCALHPLGGDATMQYYEQNYHYPLFEQGRCPIPAGMEEPEPLGYSLVFGGDRPGGTTCGLTFSDLAGPTFASERDVAKYNPGLPYAGGIFFFVSPVQLPAVKESLGVEDSPAAEQDPVEVLSRLIQAIRSARGLTDLNSKIDIPIVVCLSKMDMVEHLLDPASFIAHSSRHLRDAGLDAIDWKSCNLEVQSLLESWGGRELVGQVKAHFSSYGFSAFSALGSQPAGARIHRVAPHRVLDPLLWMLRKHKIIGRTS